MRRLGSLVMRAAEASRVPAGAALAVDRERFAQPSPQRAHRASARSPSSAKRSTSIPDVERRGAGDRRDRAADVRRAVGGHRARSSAPSICTSTTPSARSSSPRRSIAARCFGSRAGIGAAVGGRDRQRSTTAERDRRRRTPDESTGPACGVDDGQGDYLNCPLTREEYERFYDALVHAESATVHDFDKETVLRRLPADRGHGAPRRATRCASGR